MLRPGWPRHAAPGIVRDCKPFGRAEDACRDRRSGTHPVMTDVPRADPKVGPTAQPTARCRSRRGHDRREGGHDRVRRRRAAQRRLAAAPGQGDPDPRLGLHGGALHRADRLAPPPRSRPVPARAGPRGDDAAPPRCRGQRARAVREGPHRRRRPPCQRRDRQRRRRVRSSRHASTNGGKRRSPAPASRSRPRPHGR